MAELSCATVNKIEEHQQLPPSQQQKGIYYTKTQSPKLTRPNTTAE